MEPVYFYHSFPRRNDDQLGLQILESILKKGLLITGEQRRFNGTRNLPPDDYIQRRVCFTAIPARMLTKHSAAFGSFAIEFEGKALRGFGAMPAFYFAGELVAGTMFNEAGQMLARQLLEAYRVLGDFWRLSRDGDENQRAVINGVLRRAHRRDLPPEELYYCLEALLNLSYPTDVPGREALQYFHQREWKIVPNLALGGVWHYRDLTGEEKDDLLRLNPGFFGADLISGRRVDSCTFFSDVAGQNIVASARRVIVPDSMVDAATTLARQYGLAAPVISVVGPEFTEKGVAGA